MTIEDARADAWKYQRWIDNGLDPRDVMREQEEAQATEQAAAKAAQEAANLVKLRAG